MRKFLLLVIISTTLLAGCISLPAVPASSTETLPPANSAVGSDIPTGTPEVAPLPTYTPDLCSPEQVVNSIHPVNQLIREFDDMAALSSNGTRDQLLTFISELQRIRRSSEDLTVPVCIKDLKELSIVYMNTYIQTLLAFTGGAEEASINQGISLSRQLHNQYMVEMARLQGIYAPPTQVPTATLVDPKATPAPVMPTPMVPVATNLGISTVELRTQPAIDALVMGALAPGQSALALGQNQAGTWILVEVPGQAGTTAWVYGPLLTLSGPQPLPIVSE